MPNIVRSGRKVRFPALAVKQMRKRAQAKRSGANLRRLIKKAIIGVSETKYVANTYNSYTVPFAANWSAPTNITAIGSYHPGLPALTQGVGDFQRVGQKILPTKVYTDLTVGYQATDLSCNEVIVVIYYGTNKAGKTWKAGTPIQSAADLLDNGDGTTGPFTGNKADLLYPINKNMYNAKRITFRLGKTEGALNDNGAVANLPNGAYATSNGGSFKTVRLNFSPPKALVYDLAMDVWPANYAPWYAISFTRVDDRATDSVLDANKINVSALSHMYYKDV